MERAKAKFQDQVIAKCSTGGYVWTKNDLEKFRQLLEPQNLDADKKFLRSLIQNPGVGFSRPTKQRKRIEKEHNENEDDLGQPLLPDVIQNYFTERRNELSSDDDTSHKGALDQVAEELSEDLMDICVPRSTTHAFFSYCDSPSFLSEVNIQLASEDYSQAEKDVIHFFMQSKSIVKLAYASQLYDRILVLHTQSLSAAESQQKVPSGKSEMNRCQSLLLKLQALSKLDLDTFEVFALVLLEPIRRQIFVPMKKNKVYHWISYILRHPVDPQNYQLDQDLDGLLRTAFIDCVSSIETDKTHHKVKIWTIPSPIVILLCKVYFPIAKVFIELLVTCAVKEYKKTQAYLIESVVERSQFNAVINCHRADKGNTYINNNPASDFNACITLMMEMIRACSLLRRLLKNVISLYKEKRPSSDCLTALRQIENKIN